MKYFCKHVLRTLAAFPLRPCLILLTVILSVATAVNAFCSESMFRDHIDKSAQRNARLGDILISVRGDSELRMLFSEDAEALAGEAAEVLGEYSLTAYLPTESSLGKLISISATDLVAADRYFQFDYTEYGSFTTQSIDRSLILSAAFAEAHGLHVGDALPLRIFNREVVYTVQAIAEPIGLLEERAALISIKGATRILAEEIPAVAVLGESFLPSNRLMLRAKDGIDVEALFHQLSQSEAFSEQTVELAANANQLSYVLFWQTTLSRLLALLVLVLCGILIGTCLHQLRRSRAGEIALFCSIGASRKHLWCLQLIENAVYALFGTLGGLLLAIPLVRNTGSLFAWNTTPLLLTPASIGFGFVFAFVLLLGFSLSPLFTRQKEIHVGEAPDSEETASLRFPPVIAISAAALLCFSLLCLRFSAEISIFFGVCALLACVCLVFTGTPYLLRLLARPPEARLSRMRRPLPVPTFACKNLKNHPSASHTTRLFAVLLMLLSTLTVCRTITENQIVLLQNAVGGDIIAANMSEKLEAELQSHPAIEETLRFQFSLDAVFAERYSTVALATSEKTSACLHPDILPERLPKAGEITISVGISRLTGAKVGDTITVSQEGVEHTLTVSEIQPLQGALIFLSEETLSGAGMVCIDLSENATDEERADLFNRMEADGVLLTDKNELLDTLPDTTSGFLKLLQRTMILSTAVSLVGIINLLAEQYRARSRERRILAQCGMTRAHIVAIYALELAVILVFSAVIAALGAGLLCLLIDHVLSAAGMALFV